MENVWLIKNRKLILTYLITITLLSCSKKSSLPLVQNNQNSKLTEIKIERIDKFKNYYFIYARDTKYSSGYKIISSDNDNSEIFSREKSKYCKIETGKVYQLELLWLSEPKQEDKVGNYLEFRRCITRFPLVEICTESGFELYECPKLKGLFFVK